MDQYVIHLVLIQHHLVDIAVGVDGLMTADITAQVTTNQDVFGLLHYLHVVHQTWVLHKKYTIVEAEKFHIYVDQDITVVHIQIVLVHLIMNCVILIKYLHVLVQDL